MSNERIRVGWPAGRRQMVLAAVLAAVATPLPAGNEPAAGLTSCRTDDGARTVIDWTTGTLRVTGRGLMPEGESNRAKARRAAMLDGYRNLAEAAKGVTVTADLPLGGIVAEDKQVATQVEAYVKGAQVVDERIEPGPPRELVLTLMAALHGVKGLGLTVVDKVVDDGPSGEERKCDATGIVVDARAPRGHQGDWPLLLPALFPTVTDFKGKTILSADEVDPERLRSFGCATYYDVAVPRGGEPPSADKVDLSAARGRIGSRPVIVQAWPVAGRNSTVYVDDEGAARLRQLAGTEILREGRVIILRRNVVPAQDVAH